MIESSGPGRAYAIPTTVLFSPVFTHLSDQVEAEGCLSVDNLRGKVWRSSSCRVEA